MISELGQYQGYSAPQYKEFVRQSLYVPMRDGVRLALDIYRPAVNGKAVDTPMPVFFSSPVLNDAGGHVDQD